MIRGGTEKRFSSRARLRSFRYAFNGLFILVREEHNAMVHIAILLSVIIAGILFRLSGEDWIAIAVVSGLVLISECFNTAIENLADIVTIANDARIKKVKDLAAAGVLISAVTAAVVGMIVFLPEILELIRK